MHGRCCRPAASSVHYATSCKQDYLYYWQMGFNSVFKGLIISRSVNHKISNVSDKVCRECQSTHFMFNNVFFRKSCHLWDNVGNYCWVRQTTDDNVLRRTHIAYWITKVTNTHSQYVILAAFPLQTLLHGLAWILRHTYFTTLVHSIYTVMCRTNVFPCKHIVDYASRDVLECVGYSTHLYPTSYFKKNMVYLRLKFQALLKWFCTYTDHNTYSKVTLCHSATPHCLT